MYPPLSYKVEAHGMPDAATASHSGSKGSWHRALFDGRPWLRVVFLRLICSGPRFGSLVSLRSLDPPLIGRFDQGHYTECPSRTCLPLACGCGGGQLGCRRGRHLAARNDTSETRKLTATPLDAPSDKMPGSMC